MLLSFREHKHLVEHNELTFYYFKIRFNPVSRDAYQIINMDNNHWICASNIGGHVYIFGINDMSNQQLRKDL